MEFGKKKHTQNTHIATFSLFYLWRLLLGNQDVSQIEEFLEEALMMEEFKHPNIMSIIGISFKDNKAYIILPFMTNGDLRTYVKEPSNVKRLQHLLKNKF